MRWMGRALVILGLLGAWYHFSSAEGDILTRLTCTVRDDVSCLTLGQKHSAIIPPTLKEDARRCKTGIAPSCLNASVALTQMDKDEEALHFAGKACSLRATGGCFVYGRNLLSENRIKESIPAFMAGCAQNDERSCLALGQLSTRFKDMKSADYAYEKACFTLLSLAGCQETARKLLRQGKTDAAIRAALSPCNGQLQQRCAPLLVQPAPQGEHGGSLRQHYLSRAVQKFSELMKEDEMRRKTHLGKTLKLRRHERQANSRKAMKELQTLSYQIRALSALEAPEVETAAFLPMATAFSQTLDYYERGLRFELLYLNSGDKRHRRQAHEAFTSVRNLYTRVAAHVAQPQQRPTLAVQTVSARMPASTHQQ